MGVQRLLLSALGYPKAQSFTHVDEQSFRSLVVWLENVKIRHYAVERRTALGDIQAADWPATFGQYLQDLECPVQAASSNENRQAVLEWLLSFAIGLEYADHASDYAAAAQVSREHQQQAAEGKLPFPDLHHPETQQQLAELFRLLHVDTSKGNTQQHLQCAKELLRDSVLPSLTDPSAQHSLAGGKVDGVPLGFQTGDAAVDGLSTVLRLLYIKDLRELQTTIDRIMVQVQEFTANPRTDASLGKVGH